jgi:hypothetical protein
MTFDLRSMCGFLLVLVGASFVGSSSIALADNGAVTWRSGSTTRFAADPRLVTRGDLFDDATSADDNDSKDALFGDNKSEHTPLLTAWHGFIHGELAYTYADPAHWSKMLVRSELDGQGSWGPHVKYRLGARFDYDFVYDTTHFYPTDVRRDQRANFLLRENYLDIDAGDWDFRVGRQQIVWGEMVGLFFADVVSAKDLREFVLPDFDIIRIPQWSARAEYFKNDFHAELVWIPVPSYDKIGKPGAEFFPAVPPAPTGFLTLFENEQLPKRTIDHTDYGARMSWLRNGWDVSAFYYRSLDAQPTFYRQIVLQPQPAFVYQARHDRITQLGGTLAKDVGDFVFKAETVYTRGRNYSVLRADDEDGVVRQDTLDLVAGVDVTLPADSRLNLQLFARTFFDHDPDIIAKRHEPGFSLLLNHKFDRGVEGEILWITSLVRTDWMLRPKVSWQFRPNWRLILGADIFGGPPLGLFGQFNDRDRVYTEVRYAF